MYSKALVKPKPPPSLPKPSATSIADNTSKASVAPVAIAAASESVVETVTKANEASEQDEEDDDYDIVSKEVRSVAEYGRLCSDYLSSLSQPGGETRQC